MKKTMIMMLWSVMLTACATRNVVMPMPDVPRVVSNEQVREEARNVDSIILKERVVERQSGDTVYLTDTRTEYRYRLRVDTVLEVRTDSIPYAVETVRYVEKELTHWQSVLIGIGMVAVMAAAMWIVSRLRRLVR